MSIGKLIVAPNGYKCLIAGEQYHFLKSHDATGRVFFVHFQVEPLKATLFTMHALDFEAGLSSKDVLIEDNPSKFPPWLKGLADLNLELIDSQRSHAVMSHSDRVDQRLAYIHAGVQLMESVYAAENPVRIINGFARACTVPQNESRYRLWLLTYLIFGRNKWSLIPPFNHIGTWDRLAKEHAKAGRPSKRYGSNHGYRITDEMRVIIVNGYIKHKAVGKSLAEIYRKVMVCEFKCEVLVDKNGRKSYVSTNGKGYPTYGQFRYWVAKSFSPDTVNTGMYGDVRTRSRLRPSQGKYSEAVTNLVQRIEADGYYTDEAPKGYVQGSVLSPLCVVTSRDVLSGKKLGIGFAFGKERKSAYRSMLFCMAVPKVFFCSLFGVSIKEEEWTGMGLPPYFGVDRGPGSSDKLIEEFENKFPLRDMAPSYQPMSKATAESSNPRGKHIEGVPTYLVSDLTPVQLVVKEIYRLLAYNDSANMEGRIEISPDLVDVYPTPNEIYRYYDSRLRNDSIPFSIPNAVRTFLEKIEVKLDSNGAWLEGLCFDSPEFLGSEIRYRLGRSNSMYVVGYCLEMCVRHIWIEVDAQLLLLNAKLKTRDDEDLLYVSLNELKQRSEARSKVLAEYRESQHPTISYYERQFEETTGKKWNSFNRRNGRRPKGDRLENKEAK